MRIAMCLIVCGAAASASAEVIANLRYETSINGGPWTGGHNPALPGSRVDVRAVALGVAGALLALRRRRPVPAGA